MTHFSPASALVWEDYDEAQLIDDVTFVTDLPIALRGATPRFVQAIQRVATRHHEAMHYRQHVMTTLGAFDYRMAVAKLMLLGAVSISLGENVSLDALALGRPRGRRILKELDNSQALRFASLWNMVDTVAAVFWKKSALIGDMRKIVDTLDIATGGLPMADAAPLSIVFDGAADESTGAYGTISVEMLTEGLARFCEFRLLQEMLGDDFGYRVWKMGGSPMSEGSIALIQESLSIPVNHPLVGAIHDVALAACPDPASGGEQFVWSKHHPGKRFRHMLQTLAERPKTLDASAWSLPIAYGIAFDAAGLQHDEVSNAYRAHAARLDADETILRPRQALASIGASLRATVPWASVYPLSVPEGSDARLADVTRPFAFVQPHGAPTGWTALDRTAVLSDATLMLVANQIENGLTLRPARRLLHRLSDEEGVRVSRGLEISTHQVFAGKVAEVLSAKLQIEREDHK